MRFIKFFKFMVDIPVSIWYKNQALADILPQQYKFVKIF